MTRIRITGLFVILLGIGIFFLGIAGFSGSLPNYLKDLGIFSYWFPTLIIGIILTVVGRKRNA
jgi:hypothetical protein